MKPLFHIGVAVVVVLGVLPPSFYGCANKQSQPEHYTETKCTIAAADVERAAAWVLSCSKVEELDQLANCEDAARRQFCTVDMVVHVGWNDVPCWKAPGVYREACLKAGWKP